MKELELLAFLKRGRAEGALQELRARFNVTQVASKHLAVLRVQPELTDQVRAVDGVQAVFDESVPQEQLAGLDPMEKLFVQAWDMRKGSKSKTRTGDALDWDAAGYEAPDIPVDD